MIGIFVAFSLLLLHTAHAKNANIMIIPTRVVMENNDHYSAIVIRNIGEATGDYHIDLADLKMLEAGGVAPYAKGETPQYSAMPYIVVSPKSFSLKPGETQTVRVILRKPENLEAGEYRSHLQVHLPNDNVDAPVRAAGRDAVIAVHASLVLAIPIIVRHGATTLSMGIDQPNLTHDANGRPSVDMYLTREGNRSSMGDISITCSQAGGASKLIKFYPGIAVYRPIPRRFVSVPLDGNAKGVNLSQCKLGIVYAAQPDEGGKTLAQTQFTPQ